MCLSEPLNPAGDPQDRAEEPGWSLLLWLELEGGRNELECA